MNLFVLSGHGSESFAAFLNGVILQKTTRQLSLQLSSQHIARVNKELDKSYVISCRGDCCSDICFVVFCNITPFNNVAKDSLPCADNTNKLILFWVKYHCFSMSNIYL